MVEVIGRGMEAEWSPDMELEGCDAEKAAALLLSVAPRRDSQGSDIEHERSLMQGNDNIANTEAASLRSTLSLTDDPSAPIGHVANGSKSPHEGEDNKDSPHIEVVAMQTLDSEGSHDGRVCISGGDLLDAAAPHMLATEHENAGVPNGVISGSCSSSSFSSRPDGNVEEKRSSGGRLRSLLDLATQELQTMDEHPEGAPRPAHMAAHAPTSPRERRGFAPSSPSGGPSWSSSGGTAPQVRSHRHHLRDRSTRRPRADSLGAPDMDAKAEAEDNDGLLAKRGTIGRDDGHVAGDVSTARRRNRRRSHSMPEGMELQARAWAGRCSTSAGRRFDPIKEELEGGNDGMAGTRSRAWKAESAARNTGSSTDHLALGSFEDAQVLIGLSRQHSGECSPTAEDGDESTGDSIHSMSLPHMLAKYADMYNKNGRIGIYTRQEREAIIERFKRKRGRRVWKKKIRYNCRKNLADKRLRVKGRFVKMSAEQRTALKRRQRSVRAARLNGRTVSLGNSSSSMDMELLGADDVSSETGSNGDANGECFEDDAEDPPGAEGPDDEEDDDVDDDVDDDDDEHEQEEPMKRVRRHSIAY